MKLWNLFVAILIWPGTKITEKLGIDPASEVGLLRSMFNTLIWTSVGLAITLLVVL